MSVLQAIYLSSDLLVVAKGKQFPRSKIVIGDWVRLNSGGAPALVVDAIDDDLVVAWWTSRSARIASPSDMRAKGPAENLKPLRLALR